MGKFIAAAKPRKVEIGLIAAGLSLMFFAAGWTVYDVQQMRSYTIFYGDRA